MKNRNGITLIALVITIIVLLILAGVAISTLTGENGILKQAEKAKTETIKAEEKELMGLAYNALKTEKLSKGDNSEITIEEFQKELKTNGVTISDAKISQDEAGIITIEMPSGNKYTITQAGVIKYVGKGTPGDSGEVEEPKPEPEGPITDYVQVGQYVDYEPTKTDVNKTQAVEASKLTYTSPTGTIPTDSTGKITHGNGYTSAEEGGGQTFTAKANDGTTTGLKWRVLSVSEDKVELISDTVVQTDANANFILKGGIGYLYAEQELNEVCKIYGYGYGADTTARGTYTIGGPEDPEFQQIKTIQEPSGARSITIEDLNKIAGIEEKAGTMKDRDGNVLNSDYGTTTNPTIEVYYPTLYSSNTSKPGQSTSTKSGFKYTSYSWNNSKITDTNIQSMLLNGFYWIASRAVATKTDSLGQATFGPRYVSNKEINTNVLCAGLSVYLHQTNFDQYYGVRPVVTLKPEVIDLTTNYETEGEWKLK